jgi:Coenzyme PQQ synthesis protein D (PqqD)
MATMADELRLRADAVEWRLVEGEIIALDLERSVYLAVNASGTLLWPALAEGTTQETLVEQLMESFGIDRAAAEHDVAAFVQALREQGLVTSPA